MQFPFWKMVRQFGGRSIYVRLTLGALLVIGVSTGLRLLFVITVLNHDITEMGRSNQLSTATYIAKDVGAGLETRREFLRLAARHFPIGAEESADRAKRWLDGNVSYRLLFPAGLALYDVAGATIAATWQETGPAPAAAGQPWLQRAIDTPDPIVAQLYRSGSEATPSLLMAMAVRDGTGRPLAVIAGATALLEANFLKPVYEQTIGETGGVLVVDPVANQIVVSSNRPQILAPAAAPGVNPLHDKARAGWRGIGETTAASGRKVLSAIVSIPGSDWFLVAHQPIDQAYRPAERVKKNMLIVDALCVVVATVVIYVSLGYLFGPLIYAAQRLHAMARKDEPVDFLPVRRHDEIGEIVTGFNSLLRTLREKEEQLRENEALMKHMAYHDALTGLPNVTLFRDRLTQSLSYALRSNGSLTLLYLDLDGFKPINDRHGHSAGDAVLREIARRVSSLLRRNDTFARIGGDEFAVILADPEHTENQAQIVVDKCRDAICRPIDIGGMAISVGVSIGVAHFPDDGATEAELLERADSAMYRAKRAARTAESAPR
jgi:diguanylate cyclase (GGDEF)-like protein